MGIHHVGRLQQSGSEKEFIFAALPIDRGPCKDEPTQQTQHVETMMFPTSAKLAQH